MKLIVEKQDEFVKTIKIEYTPAEALIINHAMRRYACDEEVNKKDREIMERMLEVEPIFTDFEHKAEIVISQLRADRDKLQEAIKALGDDMRICQKSIKNKKVFIGFNMAVALCNKHLAESEDKE